MKYILDTSALLSGKEFIINDEFELVTVPSVEAELKKGPSNPDDDWTEIQLKFENLINTGLKIIQPSDESMVKIDDGCEIEIDPDPGQSAALLATIVAHIGLAGLLVRGG